MTTTDRPLFISQEKLTQWESEGKVNVNNNELALLAEKRTYTLVEAVRFMKLVGDDPDKLGLIGKVRTKDQLKQLNAEHYMASCIIGDVAYEVQEGFVGSILLATRPTVAPPVHKAHGPRAAAPAPVAPAPVVPTAPAPAPLPVPVAANPANAPLTPASITDALQGKDKPAETTATDAELLANFLLDNLAG